MILKCPWTLTLTFIILLNGAIFLICQISNRYNFIVFKDIWTIFEAFFCPTKRHRFWKFEWNWLSGLFKNVRNGLGFKPKSKIKFSQKRLLDCRLYFQNYCRILSPTSFQILKKIYCTDFEKMGNSPKFPKISPSNISQTVRYISTKLCWLKHIIVFHTQ